MRSADGGAGFGGPADFGALAQQYWNAVSEAVRSAGGTAKPQDPWQATMDSWSQLAGGRQRNDASDAVERFSAQARQWLGMMQQVAGQFAGQSASAEDIAGAWKQAMGEGGNPFASLFSGMTGRGQSGFDQWYQQAAPMLNGMLGGGMRDGGLFAGLRQQGMNGLHTPAFGLHREHQERWQALAEAQLELQQANDAYNALMLEAGRDAFERFERKLAERSEPGRQLQSARALFDLWIDAAEEAYAEIALSAGFRKAYGVLVNAQMRVRAGIQREIELIGNLFGMPGRTEVDAAHRRIAELERQLRRLRDGAPTHVERTKPASAKSAPAKSAPAGSSSAGSSPAKPAKTRSVAPAAKQAAKAKPAAKKKLAAKKPKPLRAAVAPAVKRGQRPAIAAIAMPEPLKSLLSKRKPATKTAKRKR
jgi:polyhydroxyalkanoate synthase subunit PhaE